MLSISFMFHDAAQRLLCYSIKKSLKLTEVSLKIQHISTDLIKSIRKVLIDGESASNCSFHVSKHNVTDNFDLYRKKSRKIGYFQLIVPCITVAASEMMKGGHTLYHKKRHASEYETHLEVKQALKKMKPLLMKPYIEHGKLSLFNAQ